MSAHDKPSSLGDLPNRVRTALDDGRQAARQWWGEVRKEPRQFWSSALVRYSVYLIAAAGLFFLARGVIHWSTPGPSGPAADEPTKLATLHVSCVNPDCIAVYVTRQPMDFKSWPRKCDRCGQPTVYRAELCPVCRGWVARVPGAAPQCPTCAARAAATQAAKKSTSRPSGGDDSEDGW